MRRIKIKVKQIKPWRIFHFQFKTQYEMCMTMIRLQEFYESPKFRDVVFSLEEYMDWYCSEYGEGVFTYTDDWKGFNIPSHIIQEFFSRYRHQTLNSPMLRPKEYDFLEILEAALKEPLTSPEQKPFYIIGTVGGDLETMEHEMCHALFYLIPEYREEAKKVIKKYKLKTLRKTLLEEGYHKEVLVDEIQAYVLTGLLEGVRETKEIKRLKQELRTIQRKYRKGKK